MSTSSHWSAELALSISFPAQMDDNVGGSDMPAITVVELAGRRRIFRVAHRRSGVHPAGDQIDFGVAQRDVVLEFGDAHTVLSIYHGGILRCTTCCFMAFAQGRVSL